MDTNIQTDAQWSAFCGIVEGYFEGPWTAAKTSGYGGSWCVHCNDFGPRDPLAKIYKHRDFYYDLVYNEDGSVQMGSKTEEGESRKKQLEEQEYKTAILMAAAPFMKEEIDRLRALIEEAYDEGFCEGKREISAFSSSWAASKTRAKLIPQF